MRFSIIIPNYNSEKFITRLLDSIKSQTKIDVKTPEISINLLTFRHIFVMIIE